MRKFSSYGPVDRDLHYYVSREHLIQSACTQLLGENLRKGGHYITVWAPRQCGKSWIMNQVLWKLDENKDFHVVKMELEYLRNLSDLDRIVQNVGKDLVKYLGIKDVTVNTPDDFYRLFSKETLDKPLILILDEFDCLTEEAINSFAGIFRNIWNIRQKDPNPTEKKEYLLHGVALIGVRSVLGIENVKGSPFNVQRGLNIPNLTSDEVDHMFRWYERESGQKVDREVIDRVCYETGGQPGLVSWFGELLTETYNRGNDAITSQDMEYVFARAIQLLPNNNILNIISKAKQEPYKQTVLELFRTDKKQKFTFDDKNLNFLYMNGVIDTEEIGNTIYVRFSNPFTQKRLFNYFSNELFREMGRIFTPFEDMGDTITETGLNIKNLMRRYEKHIGANRSWMFREAPRRSDLRIMEAVFHFNLYEYLRGFLDRKKARVWPEFPTGNGKIDIFIQYAGKTHGLEVKSYTDESDFRDAIRQAAKYGKSLGLSEIYLIEFVQSVPDEYREKFETPVTDDETGLTVFPVFVATGE